MSINFNSIFANWKSPFITRDQLYGVTGGMINPKTIRNLDSKGEGIRGKFTIGHRKIAYPTEEVVAWLERKYMCLNSDKSKNGGKNE